MNEVDVFEDLVREFCREQNIDGVSDILNGATLDLGALLVKIEFWQESAMCRLLIDLGQSPEGREAEFYRLMLQTNFESTSHCLPILALHPESSHATLALHFRLETLEEDLSLSKIFDELLAPVVETWDEIVHSHFESESLVGDPTLSPVGLLA